MTDRRSITLIALTLALLSIGSLAIGAARLNRSLNRAFSGWL